MSSLWLVWHSCPNLLGLTANSLFSMVKVFLQIFSEHISVYWYITKVVGQMYLFIAFILGPVCVSETGAAWASTHSQPLWSIPTPIFYTNI